MGRVIGAVLVVASVILIAEVVNEPGTQLLKSGAAGALMGVGLSLIKDSQ